jgi:hypothetical protein
MKTLTETQKKWALTACLMTALSFNLSAHVKADKEISLDFASEGIAFDVTNSKGVRDAKAWKTGDNGEYTVKVEAAPGCNCEPETVDIKVQTDKQGKDLENLIKVATYAKIEAKADRKAAPKSDDEDSQDPQEISEEEDLMKSRRERFNKEFKRSFDRCEAKDTRCQKDAFLDILRKYQNKDEDKRPTDKQVSDWFENKLARKILLSIVSERNKLKNAENPYMQSWALQQTASTQNDKFEAAINALESLIESIPEGYSDTRAKIAQLVAAIQQQAVKEFASNLNSLTNLGPDQYQTKVLVADMYQQSMTNLNQSLDSLVNARCTLNGATCNAINAGYIDELKAQEIYQQTLGSRDYTSAINGAIVKRTIMTPRGPEQRVEINPNILTSSSTFGPNGGPTSEMQKPRDLSNRNVTVQKAPTSSIVYVGGKAYQEIGDVTTVEQTPSVVTTSDVLKFFDEMDATQQSIRARTELHRQYKINQ